MALVEPGQGRDVSGGGVSVLPHQGDQGGRVPGLSQEWMVEKLHGAGSLCGVTNQHLVQETL